MLVLLLVAKDVPLDLSGSARSELKLAACRILVIEDEPVIALDLVMILAGQGAHVIGPAARIDDALGLLEQVAVDVVLLNVMLGRMPVWPVVNWLIQRSIPFVFITGTSAAIPSVYAAAPRLAKPVDADELVEVLSSLRPALI